VFHNKLNGFYLEMGAMNGVDLSNSRWFQLAAGWRGMLIEACPGAACGCWAPLLAARPPAGPQQTPLREQEQSRLRLPSPRSLPAPLPAP
jgi:hypothetical protein